ncbi:hypothetical protein NA56DRAFT_707358 [Hyaloscypha hepaticicola]|uniref:RNase H type-1 domain-containing protein n=1 Tax=Hyaloscypha hepaticicola TaxID=2082293 RepID=A0A2J6PUB0_9HELO|nr:hypothetical protein NA56DRAFT_707358 [Hyaloscypha hepaticicola]
MKFALRTVKEFSLAAGIKLLVLKVSSNYLPQHMEDTVFRWEKNSYCNCWGQRVVHEELFRELQQPFLTLENEGTEVKLWRVARKLNKFAEKLAKSAR